MAKFQEVIDAVPAVAAVRRLVDDGRRALLRDRRVGRRRRTRTRTSPTTPRPATSRLFKIAWCEWKLGDTDAGREGLQARARQGRRGRAHRHRGAAPAQRLARATRRSSTSSSCSPRIARSRAQGGVRLPRVDRRRAVLARRHDQGRRELRRAGRVGALERGVPVPHQDGSGLDQGRRLPARHRRELEQRRSTSSSAQDEIKVLLDELRPEHRVGQGAEEPRRARPLARDHRGARRASPRRTSTARRSAARRR